MVLPLLTRLLIHTLAVSPTRTEDVVLLADKDAVIYKLREHITKVAADKTNLTDQVLLLRKVIVTC